MKITKFFATALVLMGTVAFADEAYDVMKTSTTLKAPDFSQSEMNLDTYSKTGKLEEHQIMQQIGTRKKDPSNKDNDLIYTTFEFKTSPTNKGTRILQMEKSAKDDDRWIFLPQLKSVRRIPTGDRYKSFVGCEFTYNDMSVRDVNCDKHEMLDPNASITIDGNTSGGTWGKTTYSCWKIKSSPATPADAKSIEYSYRISYIDKNTYLPVKVEFFDKKDQSKLIKSIIIEKIEQVTSTAGNKYPLRRSAMAINEITGRKTRVWIGNITWDKPLSDKNFTQDWLTTGKTK